MSAKAQIRAEGLDSGLTPSIVEAWNKAAERLRVTLGEDIFNSWFSSLRLEEYLGGRARFSVSTRFLKSWIEGHYHDKVLSAFASECEGVNAIEISVRTLAAPSSASITNLKPRETRQQGAAARDPVALAAVATPPAAVRSADHKAKHGSPLDRRLTFSTFVVGRANQLAFSLARKLSEGRQSDAQMSPLFIHASVGLGKTHLLQAIAHAALGRNQTVLYLTAEAFMYGFVSALRSQTAHTFKESLRAIDLLIFDDAQFLQGRVIQGEFGHVLNWLIDSGRQVVIAADRPPSELENVDERVRSRLAGGICVEMQGFDESLRLKILEGRLQVAQQIYPSLDVSRDVLAFVANAIASNGRDLEGAMNRLIAHAQLGASPLSIGSAETAIRDLIRTREPKRVKIEDIQKLVATHYNVSRADLLSSRRTAVVVMPRQIAMYLSKQLTLRSLPEIGRRFGGRDHTTVLHAVRKIDGLYNSNQSLRDELELLKRMLQE